MVVATVDTHPHAEVTTEAWNAAMSATHATRQTVADWAHVQFPKRDTAEIEHDILCGLRIAIEHEIDFERAMRYAVVRGVMVSPLSHMYFN